MIHQMTLWQCQVIKKEQEFYSDFFVAIFSGWRRLRYFDLDEHQIEPGTNKTSIQKLGNQWRVIFDFKPTAYQSAGWVSIFGLHLEQPQGWAYYIDISLERGSVSLCSDEYGLGESMQLPEVGKWTRFELSREFDESAGKYILSLSIGGAEVVKAEDKDNLHLQPEDVSIAIPDDDYDYDQAWDIFCFIRSIVVLEKS